MSGGIICGAKKFHLILQVTGDEDDKYLIATSEQPISAYHSEEWFESPEKQLPIK